MLSGIEAWKKVKGDNIEFGYDYVYQSDKNQNKKGDREVASGKFDKKAGSMIYEKYSERNGVKSSKYVVEVTSNSDNSYSSQIYIIGDSGNGGKAAKNLTGYFTWFEGENIISVLGEKENAEFDFSYNSIFGKKNVKPEEMVKGMKVNLKTSYLDGNAKYEELKVD